MLPYEIIQKKRNGLHLTREELSDFINGFLVGEVPDYQMAAFLMAVYFQGMTDEETSVLTEVMISTGVRLKPAPRKISVDKHSTGGVGDKVSIPLIPLLASCDLVVPMISGRGLGHTGGTLDKIEAIPNFKTNLTEHQFLKQVDTIGMALVAQTEKIVPADKKMYALRDVTATVDSIPLISASIMSKKIAEGVQHLVLDVKTGKGAFMQRFEDAKQLAKTMVEIGRNSGLNVRAIISDMNQPLGKAVGNALEINEAVQLLRGKGPSDFTKLTLFLAAQLLEMAGVVNSFSEGESRLKSVIESGLALEMFDKLITAQGGDSSFLNNEKGLSAAKFQYNFEAPSTGIIQEIDPVKIGFAATVLGGGRLKSDDKIDHSVGLIIHSSLGDSVKQKTHLATLYYNNKEKLNAALSYVKSAFIIGDAQKNTTDLIYDIIVN